MRADAFLQLKGSMAMMFECTPNVKQTSVKHVLHDSVTFGACLGGANNIRFASAMQLQTM